MTVNFVHDAKHSAAVVTYPLQVLAFAGEGLSCRWEGGGDKSGGSDTLTESDKMHDVSFNLQKVPLKQSWPK